MFPGFNNKKHSTVSSGDWDRDGKPNRGDCNAFDWRKQDGYEPFDKVSMDNQKAMKSFAPGERELIKDRLEKHRLKRKRESEDDQAWNKLTPRQKALAQEGMFDY